MKKLISELENKRAGHKYAKERLEELSKITDFEKGLLHGNIKMIEMLNYILSELRTKN